MEDQNWDVSEEIVKAVAKRLKDVTDPQQRLDILRTIDVKLLNASGIPMDGKMIQDTSPEESRASQELSAVVGTKNTSNRNKATIYPFPRTSSSGAGPVFFIEEATGEIYVASIKKNRNASEWSYPAGYIDPIPDNTPEIIPDRVSEAERNKKEEATQGINIKERSNIDDRMEKETITLPDRNNFRNIVGEQIARNNREWGWKPTNYLEDGGKVRDLLAESGQPVSDKLDVNTEETFKREAREEAGIVIDNYPQAVILFVKSGSTPFVNSGGQREAHVDNLYTANLGVLAEAPQLKPGIDIVETAWQKVSDIKRNEADDYIASDGARYNPYAILPIEMSLNTVLDNAIQAISLYHDRFAKDILPKFNSAVNVKAHLSSTFSGEMERMGCVEGICDVGGRIMDVYAEKYPAIHRVVSQDLGEHGKLDTLVGEEGQKNFRAFVAAAKYMTQNKGTVNLDDMNNTIQEFIDKPEVFAATMKDWQFKEIRKIVPERDGIAL